MNGSSRYGNGLGICIMYIPNMHVILASLLQVLPTVPDSHNHAVPWTFRALPRRTVFICSMPYHFIRAYHTMYTVHCSVSFTPAVSLLSVAVLFQSIRTRPTPQSERYGDVYWHRKSALTVAHGPLQTDPGETHLPGRPTVTRSRRHEVMTS